ncbi:MAG TPA: cytochrome C oxidase subunit IV family protein [Acidimicrobiales bacterium]|jgi:cytochrome c oxidase subunit 4|nr:cytochrome C oxidase subunit IV family protein [Acidimicrobiales bacterium]MDP6213579.1 cytochrome C oxidase subunit IV family protein [Acidimicrobiales bacterium]MDP7209519.1 cytochrome C oxidase subunit IV family protein [Acidimicrobiales bacterium]MDP7550838.1 cytochrome C oxidase subunit IV family protein [Acidimicrobiales bacterium]HJL89806.1 cytochrome C oxidase subunit IV family protein [Acidimicrobiales bacterium]|tara:strand:+ start:2484 stop:2816 length:333 start_codon:yes stop_codon:yes gene_type:complete
MSTAEITEEQNDVVHDDDHDHPSDSKYFQIALILGVLTALEVATYYVDIGPALIPVLMVMMVVKFFIVAAWFMHLRFDNSLFTKFFVGGLVLAVAVYVIALSTFEFWSKG